eukprot:XP_022263976.1 uncharacterized protein LOC111091799 isoform X2 [Canis lupus familiaris]
MVFNPLHMFISLIFVGPFDWQTTELSGTVSETLQTTQCSMPPSLSLQPREGEEQMALATSRNRLTISTTNSQCPPSPPVTRVECQGPPGEARPPALLTRPAHAQLQHRYCHSPEPGLSLLGLVPDPRGALEIRWKGSRANFLFFSAESRRLVALGTFQLPVIAGKGTLQAVVRCVEDRTGTWKAICTLFFQDKGL